MRKQIAYIAPLQTAKVLAVLHFIVSLVVAVLLMLHRAIWAASGYSYGMGGGMGRMGGGMGGRMGGMGGMGYGGGHHGRFLILMPFITTIIGFFAVLFAAWVYNRVAGWIGGVEYSVADLPSTPSSK